MRSWGYSAEDGPAAPAPGGDRCGRERCWPPCWWGAPCSPRAARPRRRRRRRPARRARSCWSARYKGHAGRYTSIQAAVDAAAPGDWILVAPGDYHETADSTSLAADPAHGDSAGVIITKARPPPAGHGPFHRGGRRHQAGLARVHERPGRPDLRSVDPTGKAYGRNGIVVWKADDVSIDNLTACNFLGGSGDSGNGIWWNGGADSAKIGTARLLGQLPDGHVDVLLEQHHGRRVRDLLPGRLGPGDVEPDLRQQHQRLGRLRRCVPAGVRHHHRPRLDGVQRARLLGNQLGRGDRRRELAVRQQPARASTPTPRSPATRRRPRTAPARTAGPVRSPTPTRAGCSSTTTCTTTTTRTCQARAMRGRPPSGRA